MRSRLGRMSAIVQDLSVPRLAVKAPAGERFYVHIASACLLVAVVGFAPTYWVPLFRGTLDIPAIAHVHAAVFYAWTLLFLVQTWLAANRKLTRHREWGVVGVALATTMVFVGMAAAITSLKQSTADGFGDAVRAFTILPVSGIVFFVALFALALIKVRQLEIHKRLMLVATVSLLQAAVGRWFLIFVAPVPAVGGPVSPPPVLVTIMPGLAVGSADRRRHGARPQDEGPRASGLLDGWWRVGGSPSPARPAQRHDCLDASRVLAGDGVVIEPRIAA